jgi:hypothetical protein
MTREAKHQVKNTHNDISLQMLQCHKSVETADQSVESSRTEFKNNGSVKQLLEILKFSVVESKTVFILEGEEENNDKENIGSRDTSLIGYCGQLPIPVAARSKA